MTAKQMFEALLTELSKVNAPSMLLQDFNYFLNKAVNQYVNKRYNIYDTNQQTTDDLRVLKAEAEINCDSAVGDDATGKYCEINLPADYLHMLNCICVYTLKKPYKCYDEGNHVAFSARRLTSDAWSIVLNDYYNRPLPWRPYYYIHNKNENQNMPTSTVTDFKVDGEGVIQSPFSRDVTIGNENTTTSVVNKQAHTRIGNPTNVRMEIRFGKDDDTFELKKVKIDYVKIPQFIRLTQTQVDKIEDTSQILEFPEYVCQEIINELVMLVMENTADPRLQTHIPVTQSIASPAQQQTKSK